MTTLLRVLELLVLLVGACGLSAFGVAMLWVAKSYASDGKVRRDTLNLLRESTASMNNVAQAIANASNEPHEPWQDK